jgi:uncharacterized protein YodC (DUF2158 family)
VILTDCKHMQILAYSKDRFLGKYSCKWYDGKQWKCDKCLMYERSDQNEKTEEN